MKFNDNDTDRRKFLKLLASIGATSALGNMSLINEALAGDTNNDYKALVCVFLLGGNDSFNMFIPTDEASYIKYKDARGDEISIGDKKIAIPTPNAGQMFLNYVTNPYSGSEKTAYTYGSYDLQSKGIPLGVNALMPELAHLINDNKASVIANIGNLVKPFYKNDPKDKEPKFLFAHNHQQRALQTGQGDNLDDIGWAGKVADNWGTGTQDKLNSISFAGNNRMLIGNKTQPIVLKSGPLPVFKQKNDSNKYFSGMNEEHKTLLKSLNSGSNNEFEKLYNGILEKSITSFDRLNKDYGTEVLYNTLGSYGESLFANVKKQKLGFSKPLKGSLFKQLESVAKMIKVGVEKQKGRQIFFVAMEGFDTHSNLKEGHPALLRELSLGLYKFQTALKENGAENMVTTFTMSDFGRSLSPNNGDGTDHGWGGHQIVMGGAINGGEMFGTLPNLDSENGGESNQDYYSKGGQIIPTTSQDQLNATLCKWFGVDEDVISTKLFPNVGNFDSKYLAGLF